MTRAPSTPRDDVRERGQVIVMFAGGIVLFVLLLAIVLDVSWYWANTLRVQRAADAAALAGAVYLPGDATTAYARARAEAQKNGYTSGTGGTVVTPTQDSTNPRQLNVVLSADVGTYFMRVIGISQITATRTSKAEFVLPVPMGSPENYYGVFGTLRGDTYTAPQTVRTDADTGFDPATTVPATVWTTPLSANGTQDLSYAVSPTAATNTSQQWSTFNLTSGTSPQIPASAVINAVQVEFRGLVSGFSTPPSCKVNVALSWGAGVAGTWSSVLSTPNLTTTKTTHPAFPPNPPNDTSAWGPHTWVRDDFSNTNLRLRLSWGSATGTGQVNTAANCPTTRTVSVDTLRLKVYYHTTTTTTQTVTTNDPLQGPGTACANGAAGCYNPDGAALNPRGFWATMNTRGASNVNGDAHQPRYDTSTSTVAPVCPAGDSRSCYDPEQYYNYAVEMPPNSTGGYVYVFDPGFCATANNKGTGDRWFGSSTAVSSWYELWQDDDNTPYYLSDDAFVASSGSLFTNMDASDSTMGGGTNGAECLQTSTAYGDGRDYHNSWFLLNPGDPLTGDANGTIYRVHTTGTDPAGALLSNTDGEQSFALYAEATGGTPRIYGMGAMQMFTPLSSTGGATSSEFYLAQIDGAHEGKTVEIELWDPGDTSPLTANLEILVPGSAGWSPALLDYTARVGTSNSSANSACNSNARTNWPNIVTEATGVQPGEFNGCWLTILVKVPTGYGSACTVSGNPAACHGGWWKIRYNMTGTGTSNDVTTWKVSIRGNPVHLKMQ